MKIVITTPLYPPDTAPLAVYTKELAKRLSKDNSVIVITYAHMPEKLDGVKIISVNKRQPLPLRLISFTYTLFKNSKDADIIYTENGASVELPVFVSSLLKRRPLILHIGDKPAFEHAEKSFLLRMIKNLICRRANEVVTDTPMERPEILPFVENDSSEEIKYEESWEKHTTQLREIFEKHGK